MSSQLRHSILYKNPVYFMEKIIVWIFARLTLIESKLSASDEIKIQTLHKLGLGYRRIVSKFPDKHFEHLL